MRRPFSIELAKQIPENSCIQSGWFAVQFTQQRQSDQPQSYEVSFLAYFGITNSLKKISLIGLYSSKPLLESTYLRDFWFDCRTIADCPRKEPAKYKFHQLFVAKKLCLQLEADLLSLVSRDLNLSDLSSTSILEQDDYSQLTGDGFHCDFKYFYR